MAIAIIEISYGQIAVFDALLTTPFNDWTEEHARQGFAWRPGSVSFRTLDGDGPTTLEVISAHGFADSSSGAERIIAVPFAVPEHGQIVVASIGSEFAIRVQPGEYELTFEHGRDEGGAMWTCLYFQRVLNPVDARVLRSDAALSPPPVLVMTAKPA